jgi:hypothetical protein
MHHIAETQVGFAEHLQPYLNDGPKGYSHQHNAMICGNILIRNDCAVNISASMYREHVSPHDSYVLESLDGGGIHCCGRCEHLVEEFVSLPAVKCIDLGQSDMNDVRAIHNRAGERRVPLVRVQACDRELRRGLILNEFPTGVTLVHHAESLAEARHTVESYRRITEGRKGL